MPLNKTDLQIIASKVGAKMLSCFHSGKEFNLSSYEIKGMFERGVCEYTGHRFNMVQSATFERINPFLGYVTGNVVLVTQAANAQKGCLDNFIKSQDIPIEMRIKLLRKATYVLEKKLKEEGQ